MSLTLPEPTEFEQALSARLQTLICEEIDRQGGVISFNRYMDMALYTPGLGYYAAGAQKFGAGGDFITAPELSPLFSQCLAQQCNQILDEINQGDILELGAGSGIMAAELLAELERQQSVPKHYYILELSAELKHRQQQTLQEKVPDLLDRVVWLDGLPQHFSGIVLANEVLDAMPVTCFEQRENTLFERGVTYEGDELLWAERPADTALTRTVLDCEQIGWILPYQSEINPALSAWFEALQASIQQAVVILIDYGYPRSEYYHPQRQTGTLVCHYRHHVTTDPFQWPGLQDITANVDFTAVAEAGGSAGFKLSGYTTQSWFLMANGLETFYLQAEAQSDRQRVELSRQIKLLTLPSEMGERFQVIAFSKEVDLPLSSFTVRDLSHRL